MYLQVLTGDSGREGGKGDELVLHFGDGTLCCRLWVLGDALNGNARGLFGGDNDSDCMKYESRKAMEEEEMVGSPTRKRRVVL